MNFTQIGKSSDWLSDNGEFCIIADNDNFNGAYFPCIRGGDGIDLPIKWEHLTAESTSWDDAKKVCGHY